MTIASSFDATHRGPAVRDADIDHILTSAADAFERLAGSDLLITGGGGFLGYYLTQAALAYGDRDPARPIQVTVFDSFIRGLPDWLDELRDHPRLTVRTQDLRDPLPDDMPDFDFIIHAAGIASPTYYRAHPIETMDANINGLRTLLDHARRPVRARATGPRVPVLLEQRDLRRPLRRRDPDAGDLSRERVLHRPARLLRRVEAVRRDAVRDVRPASTACPITMARPFNNYGPGMKITDGRVIADFARNILDGTDIVMLSDGIADADVLLRRRRGGRLLQGPRPGPPRRALQRRRRRARDLDDRPGRAPWARPAKTCSGTPARSRPASARRPTTSSTTRPGGGPSIEQGPGRARRSIPRIGLEDGLRRTLLWYRDNQGGERR